ncbi:MAG: uracil-DNA glycosylase [Casimicrobiaceae bacterium]
MQFPLAVTSEAERVPAPSAVYDPGCRRCPRLAAFRDVIRELHTDYWCKPVPPFGPTSARLVIVGLAPGMHGANASGRPFTGDFAGMILFATLFDYGFASQPHGATRDDGLTLLDCRITNAVKCLPPQNKPVPQEVATCNNFLAADLSRVPAHGVILALGRIAHAATLRALERKPSGHPFAHGAEHALEEGRMLIDSYHCSRYNTNTGRLTPAMFRAVFDRISAHLSAPVAIGVALRTCR